MKIEVRADGTVHIEGYVNAVGRDSRPIVTAEGRCVEMIEPGTFRKELEKRGNIKLLLNHDKDKVYASIENGTLKLVEDNIGLRAVADINDPVIAAKARNKELRGWSFGMYVTESTMETRENQLPRRHVSGLTLEEVSLIDMRKTPCYAGTSVECRAGGDTVLEERAAEISDSDYSVITPDYSSYENRIKNLN